MTTTTNEISKRIKHALKNWKAECYQAVSLLNSLHDSLGISQEAHAIRAGFKYRTFRRYLQWETQPVEEYLKKLQAYLGIK